jgi:hypothetical protein
MRSALASLGGLFAAAASACTSTALPPSPPSPPLITPQVLTSAQFVTSVLADDTSVYWADNIGAVWSMPRTGGSAVSILETNVENDFPSLAISGSELYVANYTSISELPAAGGTATTLTTTSGSIMSITAANGTLYWGTMNIDSAGGLVQSMPVGGGTVTTLAASQFAASFIAVDDQNVYYGDIGAGTIDALPLQGGAVTVLASNQQGVDGLAVADGIVYWSNYSGPIGGPVGQPPPKPALGEGTINAVASTGGASRVLANSYNNSGIAVSDGYVYWSDGYKGTIYRTAIDGLQTDAVADDAIYIGPSIVGDSLFYSIDDEIKAIDLDSP